MEKIGAARRRAPRHTGSTSEALEVQGTIRPKGRVSVQAPPRGNYDCKGCNGVGNCQADFDYCQCAAGGSVSHPPIRPPMEPCQPNNQPFKGAALPSVPPAFHSSRGWGPREKQSTAARRLLSAWCVAGWTGRYCETRQKRPCTHSWRETGWEANGAPDPLLGTDGWTAGRCGGAASK
jgi:hypothetical protein